MNSCKHCKRLDGREQITAEQFKERFKVGDTVIGWSTDKKITITGIGERRFLYKAIDYSPNKERVASMTVTAWRKA